ncbi:MAG: hypothetical protein A2284_08810 [Deltaproteobacteria bacterium RIFOXYA12_FULL_61_11]|nr:MAG: hypothetical protein A2284_08810 [Deltaproteobacteria bacterium RIFOXYA12_FULL_61_11]
MVAIDENSLRYIEEYKDDPWPFNRIFYQPVIDFLTKAGARAIVFDIEFSNPFVEDGGEGDQALAAALSSSQRTILAMRLDEHGEQPPTELEPQPLLPDKLGALLLEGGKSAENRSSWTPMPPIPIFVEATAGLGFTNISLDVDGKVRRYQLFVRRGTEVVPSLALAAATLVTDSRKLLLRDGRLLSKAYDVHLNDRGEMLLNWYGRGYNAQVAGEPSPFAFYSFSHVLEAGLAEAEGRETTILGHDAFRDRIVIIGGTSPQLYDFKTTPLSSGKTAEPGLEVHATAILNLLGGQALRPLRASWSLTLTVVLSLFLFGVVFLRGSLLTSSLVYLSTGLAVLGWAYYLFALEHTYLVTTPILLGLTGSFFLPLSYRYLVEKSTKENIKKMFNHYLDPSIIDSLIANPDNLKIGGETKEMTIFFSDIQGFTTLSEKLPAGELIKVLNAYLSGPTQIIMTHGGYVDKYIGDAIMALFGAPIALPGHAALACRAALEINALLEATRYETLQTFGVSPQLITRIGLHSGPAVVGNIGSDLSTSKKFNYTAIGDAVNLASRLEGFNKVFGTRIAVSGTTRTKAGEDFLYRPLDLVAVKGKDVPIPVFELLAFRDSATPLQRELAEHFSAGVDCYQKDRRNFPSALGHFKECLRLKPDDEASKVYLKRCTVFLVAPPDPSWDGVFRAQEK